MKINEQHELLLQCTVRVESAETHSWGTGFFVGRGLILTCFHTIKGAKNLICERPYCEENGIKIEDVRFDPKLDIALLKFNPLSDHPIGKIDLRSKRQNLFSDFVSYGYPEEGRDGASLTLTGEGELRNGKIVVSKFKDGQVLRGMSGSPALSNQTGLIQDIIQETRDNFSSLGGYGLPLHYAIEAFPEISESQNQADFSGWDAINFKNQDVIGRLDRTIEESHFDLFPHERIPVEKIYIEPNFETIKYEDYENHPVRDLGKFHHASFEILSKNYVLIIFGAYGSGKTLLSKIVQLEAIKNGWNSLFFDFSKIIQETRGDRKNQFFDSLRSWSIPEKSILIIDAFDNHSRDDSDQAFKLLEDIIEESARLKIRLLVNTRYTKTPIVSVYENLALHICEAFSTDSAYFVQLGYFSAPQIDAWITAYSFNKLSIDPPFSSQQLKNEEKKVYESLANPFFLYLYCDLRLEANLDLDKLPKMYKIYKSFAQKTVRGRFQRTHLSIKDVVMAYEKFLRGISLVICRNRRQELVNKLRENRTQESMNNDRFPISIDEISERIDVALNDAKINTPESDRSALMQGFFHCYFFEANKKEWLFRDNNLLFYFLAEQISDWLLDLPEDSSIKLSDLVGKISGVYVHPIAFDLILGNLLLQESTKRIRLESFLQNLLNDNRYWSAILAKDPEESASKCLVAIIYLKLSNSRKSSVDKISYFNQLLNLSSQFSEIGLFDLFRRAFSDLHLNEIVFPQSITFEQFDFRNSKFTNVTFERGDFFECNFHDASWSSSSFNESVIKRGMFHGIHGDVKFVNSRLDSIEIKNCGDELTILFDSCDIKQLIVDNCNRINLTFLKCKRISHPVIKGVNKLVFNLKGGLVENAKFRSCAGKIIVQDRGTLNHEIKTSENLKLEYV